MASTPVRLPNDPQAPEFWQAIRQAQGSVGVIGPETVSAAIDAYLLSSAFRNDITKGTRDIYERELDVARRAWGNLPADQLRPMHVQTMMDALSAVPGKANNFLGTMRTLSKWSRTHADPFGQSITEGVKAYAVKGGHKPWTEAQIALALSEFTGAVRRAVVLAMYTGQRPSDVVRLCPTDIDDGGFRLAQRKTGREVWCPIVPELAAELARWERVPGPFVRQENGRPFARRLLDGHFKAQRDQHELLKGTTLHGLRSTAVVRLRREGLSPLQIEDIVGMSPAMIRRYCRFADKKASGKAALLHLRRTPLERSLENRGKTV